MHDGMHCVMKIFYQYQIVETFSNWIQFTAAGLNTQSNIFINDYNDIMIFTTNLCLV